MEQLDIKMIICPRYRNTNEPLETIINNLPVTGKKIFSILGSGIFPLEFLRRGAEKVVAVDNDDSQLFWSKLYFVSIENLSYDEFRKVFLKKQGKQVLSDNGFYREVISKAFDNGLAAKALETIETSSYIEKKNLICPIQTPNILLELWRACFPKYYGWARAKTEYEKVQESLKKGRLVVLKGEIPECWQQFADNSFDIAYLSNVMEWLEMEGDPQIRAEQVDSTREHLTRILTPTGIAYLSRLNGGIFPLRTNWGEVFDITDVDITKEIPGYLLTKKR